MNKSIKNRNFLQFLKEANITPIFKKDDPLDKSYYRPICILTLFSKVYKRHIYSYLLHCTEQKQPPRGVLKTCTKFTREHPDRKAISIKLLCNFTEIAHRHGCSSFLVKNVNVSI